jgi:hypothetical protein
MSNVEEGSSNLAKKETKQESPAATESSSKILFELAPGKLGTYLSFLLLVCAMVISIILMRRTDSIHISEFSEHCPVGYEDQCKQAGVVLRFSFALVIIYIIQLLGTTFVISFHDSLWIFKIIAFVGLVVGFFYSSSNVFNANGYAWAARIGGFLYIMLQQVILLDFAFSVRIK